MTTNTIGVKENFLAARARLRDLAIEAEEREAIQDEGHAALEPVAPPGVNTPRWVDPLEPAAFHGLVGEVARVLGPHTESDPAAILVQFLVCFGNAVGRAPYFEIEADSHHGNLFAVLVGRTSGGRKGTSLGQVRRLFKNADEGWTQNNITGSLSSGEGLIHAVRDPTYKDQPDKENPDSCKQICTDQGVSDKRLLVVETEFSSPLTMGQRQGNTLSATIRQAWETGDLRITNKNSPEKATDAHISIIGHITSDELLQNVAGIGVANGFANRFLLVCVQSGRPLPFGGSVTAGELGSLSNKIATALVNARRIGPMRRSPEANDLWAAVYQGLRDQPSGMVGSICARGAPQVMRLAVVYALLDGSAVIQVEHLRAALAVWTYCAASVQFIFGDATGDPVADRILPGLRGAGDDGLTGTDIHALFNRNQTAQRIDAAITRLLADRKIRTRTLAKGGVRYFAC